MHLSFLWGAQKPPKNDRSADPNGFIEQYINVVFLKAAKSDEIANVFLIQENNYQMNL